MDNVRPSQWVVLASGALLFIFSFFELAEDGDSSWGDFGVQTFPALIGLIIAGVVAAIAFGDVDLPEPILTFSVRQILVVLALTAVLIEVGYLLTLMLSDFGDPGIGLWLGSLAAIGLIVGAVMEQMDSPAASGGAPAAPTPF